MGSERQRYLIHDRDSLFTDDLRGVLAAAGIKCPRLHDIETHQLLCRRCGGLYELTAFR